MVFYLTNILIMTLTWGYLEDLCQQNRLCIKRKTFYFTALVSILWIILSGFRDASVGADTEAYMLGYTKIANTPWSQIWNNFVTKYFFGEYVKDPGYPLFAKLLQCITENPRVYLIIVAIIFFLPMRAWISRYSLNPLVSYIIFSCLFYSFFAITGIRQTIVTAFMIFVGYELIKKRKLLFFLLLYAICSTIHASAITFVPFYWISRLKITRFAILIYWIIIALSFLFTQHFLTWLQLLVGYDSYQQYDGASLGTFAYIYISIALLYSIYYKRIIISEKCSDNSAFLNAILTGAIFVPLLSINQSTMRVIQYYSIFLILLIPNAVSIFSSKKDKNIYIYASCMLLILLLIKQFPYYKFCFM